MILMKNPNRVLGDEELRSWLQDIERDRREVRSLVFEGGTDAGIEALARSPYISQLVSLYLMCSQVTDAGVEALTRSPHLTHLTFLRLHSDRLTDACVTMLVQSLHMPQLHTLDFRGLGVTDAGMEALARSPHAAKLKSLRLDGTLVTDAGMKALAQSPHLTQLGLLQLDRAYQIDSYSDALAESPYLTKLPSIALTSSELNDIGKNKLLEPPFLHQFQSICLFDTRLTIPDHVLLANDSKAILRYYRESRIGRPLRQVKVPILGVGAIGKSLLACRLSGDGSAFKENNPATHAFNVCVIPLAIDHKENGHLCSLRLFDFGGQVELHGAHRFFLADQRNVYMIVVSARLTREENRLDYWLRMVKHYGGGPVVVVVSHCDDEPGAVRGSHIRGRVLQLLDQEKLSNDQQLFVQVVDDYSNVNGTKTGQVIAALQKAVSQLDTFFTVPFAPGFLDVRDWLIGQPPPSLRDHPRFERYASIDRDFRATCQRVGQTDRKQQDLWLILLRDLGYVHYVGDRVEVMRRPENSLSNYFFDPEWVRNSVYGVVRLDGVGGRVSGKQVIATIRQDRMSDDEVRRVLALMIECQLIFPVRGGDDPDTPDYLIPDQVNVRPLGTTLDWTGEPKRKLRLRFRLLPDNLLARLVCRWFDYQPKRFPYYRDDVILRGRREACRVRLRADFKAHTLDLEFDDGPGKESLRTSLMDTLEDLLDPEGVLPKPLWEEENLSKLPETIDDGLVARIAESLLRLVTKKVLPEKLDGIKTIVRNLFETSQKLTPAEKLAYRCCVLFAYAKSDLVYMDIELPKAHKKETEDVINWLRSAGAEIKQCLEECPSPKKLKKTLVSTGSFCKGYASALEKLGVTPS